MPSVPKRKRVVDKKAIESVKKPYCEVCGRWTYCEVHHIIPCGMGGGNRIDHVYNLINICAGYGDCHDKAQKYVISQHDLFEVVAKREGVSVEEVENTVWGLKV